MTALLTISFDDGTTKQIVVDKAIEVDTSSTQQELSFRRTKKGWVMAFTKSLLDGKKLANDFLTASKQNP